MKIKNIRRLAILLSILFHLLLLFLFREAERFDLLSSETLLRKDPQEDRLVFELIETPDNIPEEEPQKESPLVSDKSTIAKDETSEEFANTQNPYSPGDLEFKEYEQPEVIPVLESGQPETVQKELKEIEEEESKDENIPDSDLLSYNQEELSVEKPPSNDPQEEMRKKLSFENLISSAADKGGISFNTYDWDFAPYMLAMKKRIESNWNPPFAYTHMGAISGTNRFRFKVMPDGKVKDLEMLGTDAHYSLDQSSSMAIEGSSPFMPLPISFPEKYLEVSVTFFYNILK